MRELFDKIKNVIKNPRDFFVGVKRERNFRDVITYYLLLVLIVLPFGLVMNILLNIGELSLAVLGYMVGIVIGIIAFALVIAVYHLFVLMFGGKKGILRTYQAYIYGATPTILVSWIPIVNILVAFYSIYLTVIGLSVLHEIRTSKAVLAYFSPLIVMLIFVVIVAVFAVKLGGLA